MALDQAANFVREQVTSAISAGDTTINVADASPFPVPPEGYNIVVWDGAAYVRPDQDPDVEIMRVTDTDTTNDTLTVARGQEGTSDFNHPDTSVVVVAQTAKMIADIASEKISNPVTETVNVDGNDVTNVGTAEVEEINSDGLAEGTTRELINADSDTAGQIIDGRQFTEASTTEVVVFDSAGPGIYFVSGADGGNRFTDIVQAAGDLVSVTTGVSRGSGVPTRSYSYSFGELSMSLSEGTFSVAVAGFALEG